MTKSFYESIFDVALYLESGAKISIMEGNPCDDEITHITTILHICTINHMPIDLISQKIDELKERNLELKQDLQHMGLYK